MNNNEQKRKEAIAKQTVETREIIGLFKTPRYFHILNEIFKNEKFDVKVFRKKFDLQDCESLTEVMRVLDDVAIIWNDEDEIYDVKDIWRIYMSIRLGRKKIYNFSKERLKPLFDSGLIYEVEKEKYTAVL